MPKRLAGRGSTSGVLASASQPTQPTSTPLSHTHGRGSHLNPPSLPTGSLNLFDPAASLRGAASSSLHALSSQHASQGGPSSTSGLTHQKAQKTQVQKAQKNKKEADVQEANGTYSCTCSTGAFTFGRQIFGCCVHVAISTCACGDQYVCMWRSACVHVAISTHVAISMCACGDQHAHDQPLPHLGVSTWAMETPRTRRNNCSLVTRAL
jgi:hypothetical protein